MTLLRYHQTRRAHQHANSDCSRILYFKLQTFSYIGWYTTSQKIQLLTYHRATHVPVGEDQRQHLEFARECATNFNATYKKKNSRRIFVPPDTILCKTSREHGIMSINTYTIQRKRNVSCRYEILMSRCRNQIQTRSPVYC